MVAGQVKSSKEKSKERYLRRMQKVQENKVVENHKVRYKAKKAKEREEQVRRIEKRALEFDAAMMEGVEVTAVIYKFKAKIDGVEEDIYALPPDLKGLPASRIKTVTDDEGKETLDFSQLMTMLPSLMMNIYILGEDEIVKDFSVITVNLPQGLQVEPVYSVKAEFKVQDVGKGKKALACSIVSLEEIKLETVEEKEG